MDPSTPQPPGQPGGYPAVLEIDRPEHVANWRPLVHWLLVIPHWIVLYVPRHRGRGRSSIVAWFVIVFTGKLPDGLANMHRPVHPLQQSDDGLPQFMREEYPPFTFGTRAADPGDYPGVRVDARSRARGPQPAHRRRSGSSS